MRVSDELVHAMTDGLDEPRVLVDDLALDLRDARALLAWIEQQCRREYHSPDDLQRTILAELEGHDEQG